MTTIIENKDLNLKLMCKMLFENMGYNTHYEIQLRNKSYINSYKTHDVSDIDVYGYKFNSDLSFSTVGAECKSGETNALEELFKFHGIVDYYKIDQGYLIKTKIHQNAREIALKNKFRCFTEAEIRRLLLGLEIDVDKRLKIENAKYHKVNNNLKYFKKRNDKIVEYITLDYWNKETWRNIHNVIHRIQAPLNTEIFREGVITIEDKFFFYYLLELFSFLVLKILSEAMNLNYSDVDSAIGTSLYGGAESLNERRRLHDIANHLTKENLNFEPQWHIHFVNISSRFSQHSLAAALIPNLIQDIYQNCFYENKIKINPVILKKYPDLTRKFTQDLMQFLIRNCRVDNTIFEDFMNI